MYSGIYANSINIAVRYEENCKTVIEPAINDPNQAPRVDIIVSMSQGKTNFGFSYTLLNLHKEIYIWTKNISIWK